MTDVLKIALDRRNKLHDEIKKLDEFIRMAEALMRVEGTAPVAEAPTIEPRVAKTETDDSPMRTAARRLSDADVRRAPEPEAADNMDAPRPSIIRCGLAG